MTKSRGYCFTINNYSDDDCVDVMFLFDDARYGVAGFEVGESGTPHIQGYVYFDNPRSFDAIKDALPTAHIELAKGSPEQAAEYCKKDGEIYEMGKCPRQGTRNDINEVFDMVKSGSTPEEIVAVTGRLNLYKSIVDYSLATSTIPCVPKIECKSDWTIEQLYEEYGNGLYLLGQYGYTDYRGEPVVLTPRFYDANLDIRIKMGLGIPVMVGYRKMVFFPKVYIV